MPQYYVNRNPQSDGYREVHERGCNQGASPLNQENLGYHASCHGAVDQARTIYVLVDGCAYCCPACHTR